MDQLSAKLAVAATKEFGKPVISLGASLGKELYNEITSKFDRCFQGHVNGVFNRCSKIKNILYRDHSVDFVSQYVGIFLSHDRKVFSDKEALLKAVSGERLMVCGTAGAGKTMFMRWSALELIRSINIYGRIPLYLELRYFDQDSANVDLVDYIFDKTSAVRDSASLGQFKKGLEAGIFVIILDAIDEVSPVFREKVVQKVLDLISDYPNCGMLISSRPDEKIESVQDFLIFRTKKMTKNQVISVINKLEYDTLVKKKIVSELESGLYENMEEFLSNPLLVTIMLLAFDHSANIPTKFTSFYHQAFEALYQRHDAAKGAYRRDHYAGLPIDRYQSIFSTFSFQTYLNYKFEFSDAELLSEFRDACEYNQQDVDPALVVRDSMECVCLLRRDGLATIFSHRSFQEYFCARFISNYKEDGIKELIDSVVSLDTLSNVLRMLYEIDPELLRYQWILPILNDFLDRVGSLDLETPDGIQKMFSVMFDEIEVNKESGLFTRTTYSKLSAANWMRSIQQASNGEVNIHDKDLRSLFWNEFPFLEYSKNVNKHHGHSKRHARNSQGSEDEIVLTSADAAWLVNTNVPQIFSSIREKAKDLLSEIELNRDSRRRKVNLIMGKVKVK